MRLCTYCASFIKKQKLFKTILLNNHFVIIIKNPLQTALAQWVDSTSHREREYFYTSFLVFYTITEIVPGSIYSQLNIQENDIITGINGKKVNSINEVTSLLGKIRDITNLSITVERDGEETTQDYSFEK